MPEDVQFHPVYAQFLSLLLGGLEGACGIIGSISGPYVFSFSNLENDFSGAFTPPSSSGSGGGGWFSGGGGGFGGGGGGAW